MNIKLCDNDSTCFGDILMGGVFKYLSVAYIKIDERHDINAVNLHTGCTTYFRDDEIVKGIRGSFVEEGAENG